MECESFAQAVLDSQVSRISVLDSKGIIVAVNKPWKEFARKNGAGVDTIDGVGINYLKITALAAKEDDYAKQALIGINKVLRGELPSFILEYAFQLPTGTEWFEMAVSPLEYEDGGVVIAHRSIDQKKQAELLIQAQRTHLNAIFHGVQEAVIAISSSRQVARINQAGLHLFDVEQDDIVGKKLSDLYSGELNDLEAIALRTLTLGAAVQDHPLDFATLPSGHKHVLVTSIPLQVEENQPHEALLLLRDVTSLYTLRLEVNENRSLGNLVGQSRAMQEIFSLIEHVAPTRSTVLILGESGTGKGVIASLLHKHSDRKEGAFVAVNCAALSDELLSSELFGHKKGAFTGALADRVGRFEYANNGTLFLDEIGDISPAMQVALLKVLEEGAFERLGDSRTMHTDVRVIAATNKNLQTKVIEGSFREDLFYRLNVVTIHVPPLRERRDDIPLLADHFRTILNREMNRGIESFSPEAMQLLQNMPWNGNVRELRNSIERAFIMCRESVIQPHHIPQDTFSRTELPQTSTVPSAFPSPATTKRKPLQEDKLLDILLRTHWNISQTANLLGYTRQHIHYLIRKYHLTKPFNL